MSVVPPRICAIETFYNHYYFRSRLEARWALALDALEIRYDYEPEGFQLADGSFYLPDFWLPQVKMWAEVKPNDERDRVVIEAEALKKCWRLAVESQYPVLILDGPPRHTNYWAIWPERLETVGWDWNDVDLFHGRQYHLHEGRFYASTGTTDAVDHTPEPDIIHAAVGAARAARFDGRGV